MESFEPRQRVILIARNLFLLPSMPALFALSLAPLVVQPATSLGGVESLIEQRLVSDLTADPCLGEPSSDYADESLCNHTS